jgi:hypothetical protein
MTAAVHVRRPGAMTVAQARVLSAIASQVEPMLPPWRHDPQRALCNNPVAMSEA